MIPCANVSRFYMEMSIDWKYKTQLPIVHRVHFRTILDTRDTSSVGFEWPFICVAIIRISIESHLRIRFNRRSFDHWHREFSWNRTECSEFSFWTWIRVSYKRFHLFLWKKYARFNLRTINIPFHVARFFVGDFFLRTYQKLAYIFNFMKFAQLIH